jgi:PadR family transcriptional regulator PadR
MKLEREWMRGAAPLAVLTLLEKREMYGYELVEALDQGSGGILALGHSTIYPLLYNLEGRGYVATKTRTAQSGRRRKYYRITKKGRGWLKKQQSQWETLVSGLSALGLTPGAPESEG